VALGNWMKSAIGRVVCLQLAAVQRLDRMIEATARDADPEKERGSVSTEQAVVTTLLVGFAIVVVTIIGKKVIGYAGALDLGGGQP
jgi:hypothetical protein